MHDEF